MRINKAVSVHSFHLVDVSPLPFLVGA